MSREFENLKMKDEFDLPLLAEQTEMGDEGIVYETFGKEKQILLTGLSEESANAIVHAVNSHDELVEQKRVAVEKVKEIHKSLGHEKKCKFTIKDHDSICDCYYGTMKEDIFEFLASIDSIGEQHP